MPRSGPILIWRISGGLDENITMATTTKNALTRDTLAQRFRAVLMDFALPLDPNDEETMAEIAKLLLQGAGHPSEPTAVQIEAAIGLTNSFVRGLEKLARGSAKD
jgi:hypothetical protein